MENERMERINSFMAKHEKNCEILSQNQVKQLKQIDDAIQIKIEERRKAEEVIRNQRINVLSISEATNISRKTFYNNELLRLYVEHRASETYGARNDNKEEIAAMKSKLSDLERTIHCFVIRDIETENLRKELAATQAELARFVSENKDLKQKYSELLSEKKQPTEQRKCQIIIPKDGKLGSHFN